jgi:hypothetical protein
LTTPAPIARATVIAVVLFGAALGVRGASAGGDDAVAPPASDLVKQANAPLSDVFQIRLQDGYTPAFRDVPGRSNAFAIGVVMPLPKYRLLPLPQLSLLTIPAAVTLPDGSTGFGDLRFVDIAVLDAGHKILVGVGPTFVFPSANEPTTGQGKWQAGPAAAIAFAPADWLVGVLAQNPISFGGKADRPDANALFLQPFVTYQLGKGWFLRSQPQMVIDWKSGTKVLPIDLGVGRTFQIGPQYVSLFVEPFWNVSPDAGTPQYGFTFGASLLYPNFWRPS